MSSQVDSKEQLRRQMRRVLQGLSGQEKAAESQRLCHLLRRQPLWEAAATALCFAPRPDEPDVLPLIREGLAAGKRIALPRYRPQSQDYAAAHIEDPDRDLQVGRYGVLEPGPGCLELEAGRFDLILVPGLGFSPGGVRLGRGLAFFDRLLARVRGIKCGVAFDPQVLLEVPARPHDIPMDFVVTPTRWLACAATAFRP